MKKQIVKIAKLDSGRLVAYDLASNNKDEFESFLPNIQLEYHGTGKEYSYDGKLQSLDETLHFWTITGPKKK